MGLGDDEAGPDTLASAIRAESSRRGDGAARGALNMPARLEDSSA